MFPRTYSKLLRGVKLLDRAFAYQSRKTNPARKRMDRLLER